MDEKQSLDLDEQKKVVSSFLSHFSVDEEEDDVEVLDNDFSNQSTVEESNIKENGTTDFSDLFSDF